MEVWVFVGFAFSATVIVVLATFARRKQIEKTYHISQPLREIVQVYRTGHTMGGVTVGEPVFRSLLSFWSGKEPSLDTTVMAWGALKTLGSLAKNGAKRDDDSEKLQVLLKDKRDEITQFMIRHYDDETGGIKHQMEAWPTIYGTFFFIFGLRWLYEIDDRTEQLSFDKVSDFLGKSRAENLIRFVQSCRKDEGGFSETPNAKFGTITTSAGCIIVWNLGQEVTDKLIPQNYVTLTEDFLLNKCRRYLDSPSESYGFVNSPEMPFPETDATRYAIRVLRHCESIRSQKHLSDLVDPLAISMFLEARKLPQGGFSKYSGEPSNVNYTYLAIDCLARLFENNVAEIKKVVTYQEVLEYLENHMNKDGGYGFESNSPSNIYESRGAALLLSLLSRIFPSERQVQRERLLASKLRESIWACLDRDTGLAVAYHP